MISPKRSDPTEKQIQDTCRHFMALDGWRLILTDLPYLRGLGVSEKGMPDDLYLRYRGPMADGWQGLHPAILIGYASQCEHLWIEWKKKAGKAAQHQLNWHVAERAHGALVWLAGVDFPASIEGFQGYYKASGLNRRLK